MSEQSEELRLALVMNGGVSLAVWMGGVTNEIFRIVTRQHPVYTALLDMTHTTARVDVISGTSAGGINGGALSLALLYGGDFGKLRDVWLKTGAFASLLRPPLGDNPGSLLMGDDFFLPQIQEAFAALAQEPQPIFTPAEMPIDLRLTTTLLRGEQGHSVDDLGTAVHDVDYRGQFRFRHASDHSDFDRRQPLIASLARAARSTASFPFAFEPSPVKGACSDLFDSQDRPIAPSKLESGEEVPRYVVDGGVLNNKPFRGALRSIFAMPAERGVRRVLAYINPDPGDGPPGQPAEHAPPLSNVLGASLFGIPQSQSIADQLAEIQAHNDRVRSRRNSVIDTTLALSPEVLDRLPGELFTIYRRRRLVATFDAFVYDELPAAARRLNLDPSGAMVGRRGRVHLLDTFLRVHWQGWIPTEWPTDRQQNASEVSCQDDEWEWGLYPVEFAVKVTLDLLRRTQQLCDFDPESRTSTSAAATSSNPAPITTTAPDWADPADRAAELDGDNDHKHRDPGGRIRSGWDRLKRRMGFGRPQIATWDREALRGRASPPTDEARPWLRQAWRDAYSCVARVERLRRNEQQIWETNAETLLRDLARGAQDVPNVGRITERQFEELFAFLSVPGRRATCGALARRIGAVFLSLSAPASALALRVQERSDLRERDRTAARELQSFLKWLAPQDGEVSACTIMRRLMQLEVIEHAQGDRDELAEDCLIELAQISGNAKSPLGGPSQAKAKLLGLQLAHFGAFYKQSWRANDWTYGRLDGSERMVKILLNPDRLQRFFPDSASALQRIKAIACDDIVSQMLRSEVQNIWTEREYEQKLLSELAFLDDRLAAVPDALPIATEVITLRLHFGILREEIDPLLSAIAMDQADGADALGASEAFIQRFSSTTDDAGRRTLPFSPEQAAHALGAGLIAGETLLDQAGSDLFTRTLAHTCATLQGVLASKAAKLGPVSVFFAALKLPVLGFYFVARGLTRQSRTSAALHAGILAVGLVIVCAQLILRGEKTPASLPDGVTAFGWAMLAYGLLFSIASSPRIVGPLMAVVALALARYFDFWPLLVGLGTWVIVWLSVRFRVLAVLQWMLGAAAIAIAALWSTHPHASSLPSIDKAIDEPVYQMALLVCLVLLLAGWRASIWSRRTERGARRLRKKVLRQ